MPSTTEKLPDLSVAKQLGLLEEEFERIKKILNRTPNFTELSIFSVMWSEHCSYKNSIIWLKTLPKTGSNILAEAGEENAGLVDLGNGLACAFKIESHNHPSAVEPYQGAATGVGGIHRDIFTMGARPIAALNSLRFGELTDSHTQHLIKGVVKGIGDYGNSFGVPTLAGEVFFDECYQTNPLVNAMSVGIVKTDETISAISYGVENPIYIVGAKTGKDGIHGATFASEELGEDAAEKLPNVQVGDPFQEKVLLEASLEVIKTGGIIGMQDMGAAGITCSTAEMSAKGEHGMNIYLDKVPTRQDNMLPFEILLSESQERMLMVVKDGMEEEVEAVFNKWDLDFAVIGEVTEGGVLKYFMNGEVVAEVPAAPLSLGSGTPVYERSFRKPSYMEEVESFDMDEIPIPNDLKAVAEQMVSHPNIASKRWVYEQYDSMVGIKNKSTNRPSDAAVVRIPDSKKGLAVTVDCNPRYVHANPFSGTAQAVAEAARNIVCSGGQPVAITNCLNFGNPYDEEVYYQFVEAIKGMGEACKAFDTPVTGGNVSFYNQMEKDAVFPTPTIGMIGVLNDVEKHMTLSFQNEGDVIFLLGESKNDIGSSQYVRSIHGIKLSPAPQFDLKKEKDLQDAISSLINKDLIQSAHDCSDGGLFVTLVESCFQNNVGFEIETDAAIRKDAFLFGEAASRVVVAVSEDSLEKFLEVIDSSKTALAKLGKVTSGQIYIDKEDFENISKWKKMYDESIENIINH